MIQSYLLEDSLCSRILARGDRIERMAQTLISKPEGLSSDEEAARVLFNQGYGITDSALLAKEARYLAQQELVGREMSV